MHYSMWGTSTQDNPNGKEKTATESFLNVQPVNDRLNQLADSFEDMEKKMTEFIGYFYLNESFKGASINYGRRFLVESPDQIWTKYETAKEKGSPKVSLDYLLNQFYQAEFANDLESLTVATKGIKLEPFVHKTDEEISENRSYFIYKYNKTYEDDRWVKVDDAKVRVEELRKDLAQIQLSEGDSYKKQQLYKLLNTFLDELSKK